MEELYSLVIKKYITQECCNYNEIYDDSSLNRIETYNNGWKVLNTYNTEEEYVKNYNNLSCMVIFKRDMIKLIKDGDKISLKIFTYLKSRRVGKRFFSKKTNLNFLTFNCRTNKLYKGNLSNYHKKRGFMKTIAQNPISTNPFNLFRSIMNGVINSSIDNIVDKSDIISKVINLYCDNIPGTDKYVNMSPEMKIYKRIYEYNGVKLPDNWDVFIFTYPQPNKKLYKKNDFKYIDSLMSLYQLNGDKIRKILHKIKNFNIKIVGFAFELFGQDFIMSRTDEEIIKIFESGILTETIDNFKFNNKREKHNAYEIFKLVIGNEISLYTFLDHIRFLTFLRPLEDVKWVSKTYQDFMEEHYIWSEKRGFYTKGDYTRIYNDEFIRKVEEVINVDGETYYPIVLTNSKSYNKESYEQSNCVKTYIDKAGSLIVSLRKGSFDSNERVTIEYRILKNDTMYNFDFLRIQSLGKFNSNLSDGWAKVVNSLDDRMYSDSILESFTSPKIKVIFGDRTIESDSVFCDINDRLYHSELRWEKNIGNISVGDYDIIDNFDDELNIF